MPRVIERDSQFRESAKEEEEEEEEDENKRKEERKVDGEEDRYY